MAAFVDSQIPFHRATENLKTNLTQLQVLAQEWDSQPLLQAFNDLSTTATTANQGNLIGNRMFYANDYIIRPARYIVSNIAQLQPSPGPAWNWLLHFLEDVLKAYAERRMRG